MTDPQLPPTGAVPPVPPAPPAYQSAPPAPPTYQQAPPAPPAYPQSAPSAPTVQPYQAPAGAPVYQASPPGAYQVPVGGYQSPAGSYQPPATEPKKSGVLGLVALILSIVAAVVTPIVAGIAGFEIGRRIPGGLDTTAPDFLSILSPARDQVLWAELSFWTGTILGITAIVIGILAIRKKQGRGTGIAALVVAVLGPIIFWVVVLVTVSTGTAAGFLP